MAAVITSIKKIRKLGPQNEPAYVYYGEFQVPLALGNYHLWEIPSKVRIVDAYVDVLVAATGGTPGNFVLGIIQDNDATTIVGATEIIIPATSSTAAAMTRMITAAGGRQQKVPDPVTNERYAVVYNREAAATTTGELIRVMLLAVRDDLT
jgi:hypothetical protein